MEELETYATLYQNMVAQYITACMIMELCLVAERRPVSMFSKM